MAAENISKISTGKKMKHDVEPDIVEFTSTTRFRMLQRLSQRLKVFSGYEERRLARVPPEERQPPSVASGIQIAIFWLGANISCECLILGLYGPLLFQLEFLDSAMCTVFGTFWGSLFTGCMAIWRPHEPDVVSRPTGQDGRVWVGIGAACK